MKYFICLCVSIFFASCLKLNNNLYVNDDKIKAYQLENYKDPTSFSLDTSYAIAQNLISIFTLSSQADGESKPTSIKALYIGDLNRISTDTVILYCHGNNGNMDGYWQRAKLLANVNGKNHYGLLMMDYRGFGLSDGTPTENGIYADVDACMKWLKAKGMGNARLIIYGFSLGTAPACKLTAEPRTLTPSKIILEAPFSSAATMVQDATQLDVPAIDVTDLKIANSEEIKKVSQPFLWLHGLNDTFLNYKTHGQVVYDNFNGVYKEKYLVAGADHSEVPPKMGFATYLTVLGKFIRRN